MASHPVARPVAVAQVVFLSAVAAVGCLLPSVALADEPAPRWDRLVLRAKSIERLVAEGETPPRAAARRTKALRSAGSTIARIEQLDLTVVAPPRGADPMAFAQALAASGDFELVQFDLKVHAARGASTPNDPLYASQWHLGTIAAPQAWSITTGDPSMVVAVCDSGIDLDHPDLAPLLVPGYNAVDHLAQSAGGQVDGLTDHGTEVAGCVAAATDNGIGIAGLGGGLRLMPVRVSNVANDTANLTDIVNGVLWAVDHGAKVVNVSFTGAETTYASDAGTYARAHGATVVWAAGNAASSLGFADPAGVLIVGATNQTDALADFSNVGAGIDLVAPGVAITTTKLGGAYSAPNGTSFAAPVVAGAVALVRSANPTLGPAAAEYVVTSTAVDLGAVGEDATFGAGRLDVGDAVGDAASALTTPLAPIALPDVMWRLASSGPALLPVLANDFDLNGQAITLTSFDPISDRGGTVSPVSGTPGTLSYLAPACLEGADTFQYTISDPDGGMTEGEVTVSTARAPTFAPPLVTTAVGAGLPEALEAADLDNDGDTDLVAVYGNAANDAVVFTRGAVGFSVTAALDLSFDIQQLRVGDVAGSARPDLVALDKTFGRLLVARGLDSGSFAAPVITSVSLPEALAVAVESGQGRDSIDLNGDGAPDLFLSTAGFPLVIQAMFGDGNGGFSVGPAKSVPGPATFMELADLTGDGAPELVAVIAGLGFVQVYGIGASGQLTLLSSQSTGATAVDLALGDVDRDGDRDVVVLGSGVLGTIPGARILRNGGNGQLDPAELLSSSGAFPISAILADFDGDGDADLAEANLLANAIGVHPGVPTASGSDAPSMLAPVAATLGTVFGPVGLATLDDNLDGLPDIAALIAGGGSYVVRVFRATAVLPQQAGADLDHDGVVGASDLAFLLGAWGTPAGDIDGDGLTEASDLAVLLGAWGASSC